MKQKGIIIASSGAIVLLLSLLLSLFLSILYYFNWFNATSITLSTSISACIAFFVGGCYLGIKIEKKVLIHSLLISVICIILSLFVIEKAMNPIMLFILNWVFYNIGVLVAMFIKKS